MPSYITEAEVRAEGFANTSTYPQAKILSLIALWSQFIDDATKQWFDSRALTVLMDGTDSDTLFLPVPIITVTSLYMNGVAGVFTSLLPATEYQVYNGRALPDDRKNPRIKLVNQVTDIYRPLGNRGGRRFFGYGYRNQKIIGTFGYVEADGSTPLLIKRAVMLLVCGPTGLRGGPLGTADTSAGGAVKRETTDGHSIEYVTSADYKQSKPGVSAITKNPEVDSIIARYRGPLKIAVPMSISLENG